MTFSWPFFCINKIPATGWPFHKGFVNAKSRIKISLSRANRGIITLHLFLKWCFPAFLPLIISFPWMDVVTAEPPITAMKGNEGKSSRDWIIACSGDHSAREAEWMKTNTSGVMPQQGGISPCRRGTTELGFGLRQGGTLGAAPSLCELPLFLPLNHKHTQRTGKSAPTNHPRLVCYMAFRVFDLSIKCCLCSRLYILSGYISNHRKRPWENNNNQTKPSRAKGLWLYQGKDEASSKSRALVDTPTITLDPVKGPQGLDLAWPLWPGFDWALSCPENHYIALISTLCKETPVLFCFTSMVTFFLCPLSAFLVSFHHQPT